MSLATRYWCVHKDNPEAGLHHDSGNGKLPRKKCSGCGGKLVAETGLWGVFAWTGTGRYPAELARQAYSRRRTAEGHADRENLATNYVANLVVRWIPHQERQS